MLTYVIQLDTMRNLKDYIYLLENFTFDGIISINRTYVDPGDLLLLFDCASFDHIMLQISKGTSEELARIGKYLKETGLLPRHALERV